MNILGHHGKCGSIASYSTFSGSSYGISTCIQRPREFSSWPSRLFLRSVTRCAPCQMISNNSPWGSASGTGRCRIRQSCLNICALMMRKTKRSTPYTMGGGSARRRRYRSSLVNSSQTQQLKRRPNSRSTEDLVGSQEQKEAYGPSKSRWN